MRNPHAGEPFGTSDEDIAAALRDVSVPALMCSLVHMTGDPSWIRGEVRPRPAVSPDIQCGIPADQQGEVRRRALAVIAAYRDGGCQPHELSRGRLSEMMAFIGTRPVEGRLAGLFFDDLDFDGTGGAIQWGGEVADEVKATSPVVVVGCGMGGIQAGIRLKQAGLPFVILEKNEGPGGTWWENHYPGARVDVGSHQYCYKFEPSDHWSEYYAQQPELRAYFRDVMDKYGLRPHVRFATTVTKLSWAEEQAQWLVTAQSADGSTDVLPARFVISAVGSLNLPRWPGIPGADTFAGPAFHSTRWPAGLDLTGTRFALVGAGATGFQIGPAIAGQAEQLTIFQRTAQWIIPNPLYHAKVPAGDRWALRHLPFYTRWFRLIQSFNGIAYGIEPFRIDPEHHDPTGQSVNAANAERAAGLVKWMTSVIADRPDLLEKVMPDYPATGKRVLIDDGTWLRTLMRPDTELVRTAIERIVPDGVVTADGKHYPADVICFATGFRHNDFLASMEVTGRGGAVLREQWGEEPTAYLGITVPRFPNLFCVYGPGTNLAAGSGLFFHSDFQTHYAMEAIRETLTSGARWCEVTQEAHDDYVAQYRAEISQLIWSSPLIKHSHYMNPAGQVFTLSPWTIDHYWEWTRKVERSAYRFG